MPYKHTRRIRTSLIEHRIVQLVKLVERGHSFSAACKFTGTSTSSFYEWKRCGRDALERRNAGVKLSKAEGFLADFVERLTKAEVDAIDNNLQVIQEAAKRGNWFAAAWWLERRHPEDWGRHRIDLIGDGEGGDLPPTGDMIQEMISRTVPQDAQANNVARSNP